MQTEDYADASELFSSDYAYFSSTSSTWLKHAQTYSVDIIRRLKLGYESFVVEIAANDGYLLQNFLRAGIPCLGVEPTASTASAAEAIGVPIVREFFGEELAGRLADNGKLADLIIGNNVYAHVPAINDFTRGIKRLLKSSGTVTLEFPHLMQLIQQTQFDTVYHEHFSYLLLSTVAQIFSSVGLRVWHVEELPTHGGSLRVYGCHDDDPRSDESSVLAMLQREKDGGFLSLDPYLKFQMRVDAVKRNLLEFLLEARRCGRRVAAYGAAAKGNTLLNYAGVKPDLLPVVFDAAAAKQGKYLPGSHVPILEPNALKSLRPDVVLILPWNLANEIVNLHSYVREWGGVFVTAMPQITLVS